eukprot:TRINITY_DN8070_c0_g3_i1.p1 TRINITY_DN8070_c0_g3~~TRINITY_DN8070_c0_g3_i1.p1  ORF type:complete len:156 (+),score=28.29 TRINITY_DN8070_c0_g3_i1:29-496(+)
MKIVVIGETQAGKTSIISRFTHDIFEAVRPFTTGAQFMEKVVDLGTKKEKMQLWELRGLEQFREVIKFYARGAHGVLFVFDITNRESFRRLEAALTLLDDTHSHAEKLLIGNKIDRSSEREVAADEAEAFATANGMRYYETVSYTHLTLPTIYSV